MTLNNKIIFFLVGNLFLTGGKYQRHKQVCSGAFAVDRTWELIVNQNGSYSYHIKTINTKEAGRRTEEILTGKWELKNDTLQLNDEPMLKSPLSFLIKENQFIPVERHPDTISGMIISLDYLEKIK